MSDHVEAEQTEWPTKCPECGTDLQSAVIDLDKGNEDRAELNPGEMVAVDFCPNSECPSNRTDPVPRADPETGAPRHGHFDAR